MQTQVTNPLEKQLSISLPVAQIEAEIENRLKRLSRTVKMQGFRPGKVPFKFVTQQYGPQVRQEVMSDSVQKRFTEAVQQQNLRVAGYPRFESKKDADGKENIELTAVFEVYPEVSVGDISGSVINRPVSGVEEADVDRTIDILCKQRVKYESVTRPAAKDDMVNIDFRGTLDGVEFDGGQGKAMQTVVGEGRMLPDFEAALVGVKKGEHKSFPLTFPADYHGKDVAGKTALFQITVNDVMAPNIPEVNADFALGLGVADGDVVKMRAEIKSNLEREVKKRKQQKLKDQVMDALLNNTSMDVPLSLVEIETQRLLESTMQDLQARGMKSKEMLNLSPDMFKEQAQRRVKLGLILGEVVKRHSLQAKPEQIRATLEDHAQSFEQPEQMVRWYYTQPERMQEVEALVLEDNVVAWALNLAKVQDQPMTMQELMGTAA
ncbi:MAG: trigger factor [Burkholderiales bacterium]